MPSRRRSAARCMVLAAAIALSVGACWSSSPTGSPSSGTVAPATPTATAGVVVASDDPSSPTSPAPTASPPAVSASPSASSSATTPVDPVAAATALGSLGSYRLSAAGLTGQGRFTAEMVVVQRPKPARSASISVGSKQIRIVTVGDKAWIDRTGTGPLAAGDFGLIDGTLGAFEPATLVSIFGGADYSVVGEETKNGALTTHYHGDATSGIGPGGATFPPGASIDLWVSVDGHLVAFEANDFPGAGGPSDLRIEVTHSNDPSNRVKRPS
jgi:hypothetical protein